nr:hypothetical protein [Tanacetum cinerariifolium]
RYHAHTARLMEGGAKASHTAWAQSMDTSDAVRTDCTKVMSDSADYSSRTHLGLRGHQSPSTARGIGGGR